METPSLLRKFYHKIYKPYQYWFWWFCVAALLEAIIISMLFYFQNKDYINTPAQNEWLSLYHSSSLIEFVVTMFILFELIRRMPWVIYGVGLVVFATHFPVLDTSQQRSINLKNVALHILCAATLVVVHGVLVQNTLQFFFRQENFPYVMYLRAFSGIFLSFLNYTLIVTVVSMVNYFRKLREEEVRTAELAQRAAQLASELAQAQLQALKMQLHPHFLFNALNSISALLYENPRRADTMIARLGDFLRMTLENPSTQFITLQQELDLLRCYLDIEIMRFPSRLNVKIVSHPSLETALIPNLLLQPLVENSVKYGILQSTEGGNIEISTRVSPSSPERLEITVRDNGPGIQPNEHSSGASSTRAFKGLVRKKTGIGLQNTRERLEKLYGDAFRFDTYNAPEGGFVVYIEIPLSFSNDKGFATQQNILTKEESTHF